jgi:RNA polymerase sigma factor (sigma-70 family)
MTESRELLAQYVNTGSEAAFGELVTRYINLVYSTALRLVGGDTQLAEDVTQTAFINLARMSKTLSNEVMLGGWLHQHTFHLASTAARGERRRKAREREVSEMNMLQDTSAAGLRDATLLLDEAITQLPSEDRTAILLRFFEQRDFRSVGEALGTSEDSARMRVNRAVDKLHGLLTARGVTMSAATLGTALTTEAVTGAPAGLAAAITTAALSGATVTTAPVIAATKAIAMTTLQKTVITAALAVAVGTGIYEARQAASTRAEVQTLQQRQGPLTEQIQQLQRERNEIARQLASLREDNERFNRDTGELRKLRGEVPRLRNALRELALKDATAGATNANDQIELKAKALSAKAHLLKQLFERMPERKIPELKYMDDQSMLWLADNADLETDAGISRVMSDFRQQAKEQLFAALLTEGLDSYTRANAGQLPTDTSQLKPYVDGADDVLLQRYQMIKTGNVSNLQSGEKVIAEKAAVDEHYDTLFQFGIRTWSWQGVGANNLHGSGGRNPAAQ